MQKEIYCLNCSTDIFYNSVGDEYIVDFPCHEVESCSSRSVLIEWQDEPTAIKISFQY